MRLEVRDDVGWLTLARPDKANTFDVELAEVAVECSVNDEIRASS